MNERVRQEVWFSGRVQGVGFRYTTSRLASNYDVTGFVKNLHDGRVWLVAEGTRDEVERLVSAVKKQMAANIHDTEVVSNRYEGQFSSFEIER